MVTFKTEKISPCVTRIFGINTELMYLVEGAQKAALIDTGSGFGSLRKAVEQLTKKPVIVLLTHGHTDHAMGAGEFDEVYMNRADNYIFGPHGDRAFRWEGMEMSSDYSLLQEKDYVDTADAAAFHDMKGGDSFDLGDIHIDIFDCPGHTCGSVVMLIREERMLLTGDACNSFTFVFEEYSLPIGEYEENLKKMKSETDGKYERILLSHGDGNGPIDIIAGVIQVCEDIKSGNVDDVPFEFRGTSGYIAKEMKIPEMLRADGGHGNVVYNKERI